MRLLRCLTLISLVVVICIPVLAADENNRTCSPVGTWFGGSGVKYQLTIIADGSDKYTVIYDPAFQVPPFSIGTKFTGVMVKKGNVFSATGMVMLNTDTTYPPAPPVIWALRETGRMPDCNSLEFTITFFAAYSWGKVPLVDEPDYYPAPTPIYETYKRTPEPD
jgi:hypothetical protein